MGSCHAMNSTYRYYECLHHKKGRRDLHISESTHVSPGEKDVSPQIRTRSYRGTDSPNKITNAFALIQAYVNT